jgi:undecaprenyl-diphosphatase
MSQLELNLFFAINHNHHPFLDVLMIAISSRWTWIPLYVLLLFFIWKYFKKRTFEILVYIVFLIVLCDQGSVIIKNTVARLRPCHEPSIASFANLADGCGGKFGFVSSHAANAMGLSLFIILVFSKLKNSYRWLMLVYVVLIGYSRIYLGAHYPSDILGGYLLGALIAIIVYYTLRPRFVYSLS